MSSNRLTSIDKRARAVGALAAMATLAVPLALSAPAGAEVASCDNGPGHGYGHACLDLSKAVSSATAAPGDTLTYTVTATNVGTTAYDSQKPAMFSDAMVGVLDDATYVGGSASATEGAVAYTAGSGISWSDTGLAPGASATITYQVVVDNPTTGDGILTNTVVSDVIHTNCAAKSDDAACTATSYITESAPMANAWVVVGAAGLVSIAAAGWVAARRRRAQGTEA